MKRNGKQVCVIGLGHFGAGLARSLAIHCEVLAVDNDLHRINDIADHVQTALCLDAREFTALSSAITTDFDEAIICIGEQLEASILCALHLHRIGIPVIRAKVSSNDHAEILRSIGVTHVVFPELETAHRLSLQIMNPNLLDFIPIAKDYQVMDVATPVSFTGRTFAELEIRSRLGLLVIAIKRESGESFEFLPGPDHVVKPKDVFVVIGKESDILKLQDGDIPPIAKDVSKIRPDPGKKRDPSLTQSQDNAPAAFLAHPTQKKCNTNTSKTSCGPEASPNSRQDSVAIKENLAPDKEPDE